MNSLSWFIYLIQVADGFRDALFATLVIGIITLGGMGIGFIVTEGELYTDKDVAPWAQRWTRRAQIGIIVALPLLILFPSRSTLLLIAGSQIGERLVNSDTVHSVVNPGMDLLREWIRTETQKLRDSGSKSK